MTATGAEIRAEFEKDGVLVFRRALPVATVEEWTFRWADYWDSREGFGRIVNRFNPVAVDEVPPALADIPKHPMLLDIAEIAFGPDIALYNYRFVVKDVRSRDAVFLHHDTPYHVGWPQKASLFVPLTAVTQENGPMTFFPGTHKYGYLGDAGEIAPELLRGRQSYTPDLRLGDVVLMHSATWHLSAPHTAGEDRVMADIIVQPASDPSGIDLLRGAWRCEPQPFLRSGKLFARSRVSRLKELEHTLG